MQAQRHMNSRITPLEFGLNLPCQDCGCRTVFPAPATPADHSSPILRCCQCGRARADLKALRDHPPRTQDRRIA